MNEMKKQRPTIENLKVYESLMQAFEECTSNNFDTRFDLIRKAEAYHKQFDWFCYTFEENGKVGIKDTFGNVVAAAKYDDVLSVPAYDYMEVTPVIVKKDGAIGVLRLHKGGKAEEITAFEYEEAKVPQFTPFTAVRKAGSDKWGLIDFDGNMVIPAEMDSINTNPANGNIFVTKDGKEGVYDFIYDGFAYPEYDSIDGMGEGGILTFVKDGVEGHVDVNGKFYSCETLERFYEGEKYDIDGSLIYEGEDEDDEPLFLADHLD